MNISGYYKKRTEKKSEGGVSNWRPVCVCVQNCFMMSQSAWGEVRVRAGVCTGVKTAIRKLCSFVMGWGADVTHLLKAWQSHTHTQHQPPRSIWMFTLLANTSGLQVPGKQKNLHKSAKLHKVPTPEQSSYEMTMIIFPGPPHLLSLLNPTFIWFSRPWHNNWPQQTTTFICLLVFPPILRAQKQFFP